jgi:hypothetical protein
MVMDDDKITCFVVMPFNAHHHYLFLFIKKHIKRKYGIDCEKADDKILTIPFPQKISNYIRKADIIIADCTGRNPNVFYELGQARFADKDVIMMTGDPPETLPSDVKHYDVIVYDRREAELLKDLDKALQNILTGRRQKLYEEAQKFYEEFSKYVGTNLPKASENKFISRVARIEKRALALFSSKDSDALAAVLLPKILKDNRPQTMKRINEWIASRPTLHEHKKQLEKQIALDN